MGKKLYRETNEGGIYFKSERKPWEVRTPNYVYDLWMPVLGIVDIGIYNVYCRLERENIVKAITLGDIAKACRIGKSRLYKINDRLEECGFILIKPPEGWRRLAHHTTEIIVLDPPQEVPIEMIKKYVQLKGGYHPLTPWLVNGFQADRPHVPNGTPKEVPNGTPKVETLGLKPLDVVLSPNGDEINDPDLPIEEKEDKKYKPGPGKVVSCVDPDTGEEVGEPDWRFPQTQTQHQAFNITGRKRFRTRTEHNKMRKIEYKLENGELPHEFWEAQKGCARKYNWSFPVLLKSTLNPDRFREWQRQQ
jgi:hypothetical protein